MTNKILFLVVAAILIIGTITPALAEIYEVIIPKYGINLDECSDKPCVIPEELFINLGDSVVTKAESEFDKNGNMIYGGGCHPATGVGAWFDQIHESKDIPRTFEEEGIFTFTCLVNPWKVLTVHVQDEKSNQNIQEYPIMISVSPDGEPGNEDSFLPSLSSDGQHVVFMSRANNLVEDDRNHQMDIFVRDLINKKTYLASVSSDGTQTAHESNYPTISGNGEFVTFYTVANFDLNDINEQSDVYVHNIKTGETTWVSFPVLSSQTGANNQPKGGGSISIISDDGKKIFFRTNARDIGLESNGNLFIFDMIRHTTSATGLHVGDFDISGDGKKIVFTTDRHLESFPDSSVGDLFVYDISSEKTTWISQPIDEFNIPSISDLGAMDFDGEFVIFRSSAPNLVENDENNDTSFFLHDLETSSTKLISIDTNSESFFANSHPDISGDGKFVLLPQRGLLLYDIELEKTTQLTSFGDSDGGINFDGNLVTSTEYRMNNSGFSQVFVTTNPPPTEPINDEIEEEEKIEQIECEEEICVNECNEMPNCIVTWKPKPIIEQPKLVVEPMVEQPKELGIASFVDKSKNPQSYVDRYTNEPSYKKWFDDNYPEYDSIEQAVGIELTQKIPTWVKNIFGWYAQDQVSENELLDAIKYLITEEIINIVN